MSIYIVHLQYVLSMSSSLLSQISTIFFHLQYKHSVFFDILFENTWGYNHGQREKVLKETSAHGQLIEFGSTPPPPVSCQPVPSTQRGERVIHRYGGMAVLADRPLSANTPWAGIILLFPPRESLVSDIPARDWNVANFFYGVMPKKRPWVWVWFNTSTLYCTSQFN